MIHQRITWSTSKSFNVCDHRAQPSIINALFRGVSALCPHHGQLGTSLPDGPNPPHPCQCALDSDVRFIGLRRSAPLIADFSRGWYYLRTSFNMSDLSSSPSIVHLASSYPWACLVALQARLDDILRRPLCLQGLLTISLGDFVVCSACSCWWSTRCLVTLAALVTCKSSLVIPRRCVTSHWHRNCQ